MQRDLRATALYHKAEAVHRVLRQPGSGVISDAMEVSATLTLAAFAGALVDVLVGAPPTRICSTDLVGGATRVLTFGPNTDRLPKFSPDGVQIAFLSDRRKAGDFQLYILDPVSGVARATASIEGWVEYLHWSPDGKRILLGVAGHGADISGGQGAVASKGAEESLPTWMPTVEGGEESHDWRSVWVYDLTTDRSHRVSRDGQNVWEAVWCGNDHVAAILSPGPGEGLWYRARLHILELATGASREIYHPRDQLGWPAASASGRHLAVVEALCSDRWIVAGDLVVIDTISGVGKRADTHGVDVTYTEWRSNRHLLIAGHRGFETVVGLYDVTGNTFSEVWCSRDLTVGGRYVTVSGIGAEGDFVLVGESFVRAPEIAVVRSGKYEPVRSFDCGYASMAASISAVECVGWHAPDGLEIQGWLLRPPGQEPHPLVMNIHGGPVWHWRPVWLGRGNVHLMMLLERGYAIFFPNPRGSGGRGQEFARHVLGDMGGADTYDYLSGLDMLVAQGIADPKRLGVTGGSYGGYMSAWLIGQDTRFAAAVAVAQVTNQVTEHLISNIPHFVSLFLADHYNNPGGKYFQRSPIMHAHKVHTPTLNVCGLLDRCTPPEEAVQFHNALRENGVESVLISYPGEGHGIRNWPASIDFATRLVCWFDDHMARPQP